MHLNEWSLREPAGRAARVAALELLSRVRQTRDRLDGAPDAEALHDFRVALRRLRSWLRAFDALFRDTVSGKSERRLKRIADATGTSRDLEVHLAWVNDRKRTLRGDQRRGGEWLIDNLSRRKTAADVELKHMLDSEFERATERVEKGLTSYSASVVDVEPRFAAVTARLIRRHATSVSKGLRMVRTIGDRGEAHAARIAVKRLRYLLDPLDKAVPDAKAIVDELGELQDRLGELHDAQLFGSEIATCVAELLAARTDDQPAPPAIAAKKKSARARKAVDDPVPGLLAISRRLRKSEQDAFAAAKKSWLGNASAPLLARVEAVADMLDQAARQGQEVTRRYVLTRLPDEVPPASISEVDVGFTRSDQLEEAVCAEEAGGARSFSRTIIAGDGTNRLAIEEPLSAAAHTALWPLTKGKRVSIRRHRVESDHAAWELLEFLDRPLVMAVVQVPHEESVPPMPDWLTAVLDKDVSEDTSFELKVLAQ